MESFSKDSKGLSLPAFLKNQGQLDESQYFQWAQAHFGMTVLKPDFFHSYQPGLEFFSKWEGLFPWNKLCVPVAEWDGILFVACHEKPENFPSHTSVCFMLASFENLQQWYQIHYGRVEQGPTKTPAAASASEALTLVSTPTADAPKKESDPVEIFSLELKETETADSFELKDESQIEEGSSDEIEASIEESETPSEMIEGLDLSTSVPAPNLNLSGLHKDLESKQHGTGDEKNPELRLEMTLSSPVLNIPEDDAKTKPSLPEATEELPNLKPMFGFQKTEPKPAIKASDFPDAVDPVDDFTSLQVLDNPANAAKNSPATESPAVVPSPKSIQSSPHPPGSKNATAASSLGKDESETRAKPKTSTPLAQESIPHDTFSFAQVIKSSPAVLNQLKTMCEPLKAHFEKYFFFGVGDNELEIQPLFWSEEFVADPSRHEVAINIKTPSIFYIVAATYKPFHGPISPNEINEKFFDDWNQGLIPSHCTMVPILFKDQLVGLLMAVGEKSANTPQILRFSEKTASEISKKISDTNLKSVA